MNAKEKEGQLASIASVDAALNDLRRSVIVTAVGARTLGEIDHQMARLRVETCNAKTVERKAVARG